MLKLPFWILYEHHRLLFGPDPSFKDDGIDVSSDAKVDATIT